MALIVDILDEMSNLIDAAVNADSGEFPVQVLGRRTFNPTPPAIDMWPGNRGEMRDHESAGFAQTNGSLLFTVRARVAPSDAFAEQELLYAFCDDESDRCVAAALQDDQTLNGYASSVEVLGPSEPTVYQDVPGQAIFLGVQWRVEILGVTN